MKIEGSTGLLLDGVFCSEAIDSSGEILDIKGLDVSDFEENRGVANYEHKGHDGDSNGEEIVGKVIHCHKIFTRSDCKNDRERMFWEKVQLPFLYGVVRLYDGAGHEGAKALAAIVRDHHANDEPIVVGFSIEGSTLEKDPDTNRLKSTIAKKVALTLRPCNKTAVSGLLADPNAPEGFEKEPVKPDILAMVPASRQTRKAEVPDALFRRLGGSEAVYGSEITKAMSAGNYNAAPGTLTGGSALQREDRHRVLKAAALAAFRDWDRATDFRKFLKSRLPEASDDFLDHFNDLVDRKLFRVKKAAEVLADLKKHGKLPKAPAEVKPAKEVLTVQGKNVPAAPPGHRGTSFDSATGALTTTRGVFHASTPSAPHPHLVAATQSAGKNWVGRPGIAKAFQDELQVQRPHHQRAMKNWLVANDKFSKGTVDPGVVSHAVAFALMSPGTPVPIQETMYGHLVDALHGQGQTVPTAQNWGAVHKDWLARNRAGFPEHSREHFRALESSIRAKNGNFIGYNKPAKFAEYFGDYLRDHHNDVVTAIRDGKGDAHHVARRLTEVRGIAPKLSRYLLGMMGAGNMVVPDTHFTRHYFGGRPDAPGEQPGTSPDSGAQDFLKSKLLNSVNSHEILEGLDHHYFQNHDAVKAVLNDPTIGPYFKGREQQATFPAFWWHWISIPGHENRIGVPNRYAQNEGTDHAPFWDAVKPLLNKAGEEYDPELHLKTAMQHHRWVEAYGPVHALDLYYRYLHPKLVANDALAGTALVQKFEALSVDLAEALEKAEPVTEISHGGRRVRPGSALLPMPGGMLRQLALLDSNAKEFTAVPRSKLGAHGPEDLVRVPRTQKGLEIENYPEHLDSPLRVDLKEHGVGEFNRHPESIALGQGFDFGAPQNRVGGSGNFWSKTSAGQTVFVKPGRHRLADKDFGSARSEGVYHALAHDFFGLGQYVPHVSVVRHPRTGQEHAIIAAAPGHEMSGKESPLTHPVLAKIRPTGDLDRLMLMDMVMGNGERHRAQMTLDHETGLHLFDHDVILRNGIHGEIPPQYLSPGYDHRQMTDLLHPKAVQWAQGLDASELGAQLRRHEVPENRVAGAVARLKALQDHLKLHPMVTQSEAWERPSHIALEKVK